MHYESKWSEVTIHTIDGYIEPERTQPQTMYIILKHCLLNIEFQSNW